MQTPAMPEGAGTVSGPSRQVAEDWLLVKSAGVVEEQ